MQRPARPRHLPEGMPRSGPRPPAPQHPTPRSIPPPLSCTSVPPRRGRRGAANRAGGPKRRAAERGGAGQPQSGAGAGPPHEAPHQKALCGPGPGGPGGSRGAEGSGARRGAAGRVRGSQNLPRRGRGGREENSQTGSLKRISGQKKKPTHISLAGKKLQVFPTTLFCFYWTPLGGKRAGAEKFAGCLPSPPPPPGGSRAPAPGRGGDG